MDIARRGSNDDDDDEGTQIKYFISTSQPFL